MNFYKILPSQNGAFDCYVHVRLDHRKLGGGSVSDYKLIRKIASGDITALDILYRKYQADVYRFAYMMTKHPQTSEDIMQDVFLAIVKNAATYKSDINVKGWILTITRNMTLNRIKQNRFAFPIGEEITNFVSEQDDFKTIEFLNILTCLNANEQEIVVLHILYGLRHKETATILSINHDTIRKRYQRALAKLKNNLAIEGDDLHVRGSQEYPKKRI